MSKNEGTLETHNLRGIPIMCPLCKNQTNEISYRYRRSDGDSFIYCCHCCGMKVLRPLVLNHFAERRMESVADAEMFHSSFLKTLHERLIVRREIYKVRSLLGKCDFSMLDVGCGTGWISRIWADSGAQVTGLEPSEARAAIARERGLRVLSCYAEDLGTDECYDLIVIRHVIEHLENPAAILRSLSSRLKPGGLLLLVVPNIDCIGRKIFDSDWTWVLPWHCNFFNPHSIRILLDTCGYLIAQTYQTPSPLWYPESFQKKFPRLGRLIGSGPASMLLFAPLIGLGYVTGFSDNITILAQPAKRDGVKRI